MKSTLCYICIGIVGFYIQLFGQTESPLRTIGSNTIVGSYAATPFQVSNIAALRAVDVTNVPNSTQVHVTGYYSVGDGGQGNFFYDSTNVSTDNAGTIIAPNAGSGRWVRVFSGYVSPLWFGALGDGTTDDSSAINSALSAASTLGAEVRFEGKVFAISSTVTIPGFLRVSGVGQNTAGTSPGTPNTVLKALTTGILMLKCSSQSFISDISLDGDNKALWGLMNTTNSSHTMFQSIEIGRCTEYGFVLNALQNATFVGCTARYNKYGWVLANGARNCNFYNCSSEVNSSVFTGNYTDARCILYMVDLSNPHGFGLATSVVFDGNSDLNWWGGIHERCNTVMAVQNYSPGSYTGTIGLRIWFHGCNLSGTHVVDTSAGYTAGFSFEDCEIASDSSSSAMGTGTAGSLTFRGYCNFNGGETLVNRGFTQQNDFRRLFFTRTDDLVISPSVGVVGSLYQFEGGSTLPYTFDATTRKFNLTGGTAGGYTYQGLMVLPGGAARSSSTTVAGTTANGMRPMIRVTFTIVSISGSGQVSVYEPLYSGTFRRKIGDYGVGVYSIVYKASQYSQGGVSFSYNGNDSFEVANISIEWL